MRTERRFEDSDVERRKGKGWRRIYCLNYRIDGMQYTWDQVKSLVSRENIGRRQDLTKEYILLSQEISQNAFNLQETLTIVARPRAYRSLRSTTKQPNNQGR